jgi:beta-1,4-N-acetylglucosaminyltransferase
MFLEFLFGGILCLILILRFLKGKPASPKQVSAVLGSGGHTNEMLRIIEGLSDELKPTIFICSLSDTLSQSKISQISTKKQQQRQIILLPRPRNVGQSYFTSTFTTLRTILFSTIMLYNCNPSLVFPTIMIFSECL